MERPEAPTEGSFFCLLYTGTSVIATDCGKAVSSIPMMGMLGWCAVVSLSLKVSSNCCVGTCNEVRLRGQIYAQKCHHLRQVMDVVRGISGL